MNTYRLVRKFIMKSIEWIVVLIMVMMALTVIWQVLSRYIPIIPATATEEIAAALMMGTGLLGAVVGFERKSHLGVDIISQIVDDSSKKIMNFAVWILVLIFALTILVWGGYLMVNESLIRGNMLNSLPKVSRAWVYIPIPLSGFFIAWISLENILSLLFGINFKDIEEVA